LRRRERGEAVNQAGKAKNWRMTMAERRYGPCASHGFFLLRQLLLPFLFFFSFLDVPPAAAATTPLPINAAQGDIMQAIARLVNSESANTKWNTADNPCSWKGISCRNSSSSSVVTSIALSNYGLSNSSIFAPLCRLDTLRNLDLSINLFTNLSPQFFASTCSMKEGLQSLNLSTNQLANSLSDLSGFPQLEVLDLSFNSFASTNLSAEFGSFPKLRSFNASANKLNGDVPTSMVSSLVELVLSRNRLSGSIPPGLFKYENLTLLDLSQNYITGTVPDNFTSLPKLETLLLSSNNLSGEIPASLSNVTTLTRFAANQNSLNGSISPGVTKYVKMLDLSYNEISGRIPPDLFLGMNLETIDLTSNNLEGHVDAKFSRSLVRLRLGTNNLSGGIPDSISNASKLAYLELDNNNLEGNIHPNLGECKNLALLNLASNMLQGQVPDEIGNLKNLVVLKLQMNNFSGSIPSTFSNFISLNALNLSYNSFSGSIPVEITNLQNLSSMNLQANKISGVIPISISLLKNLIELNLGNNLLTGSIPEMPASLSTTLNLSHNLLSGNIPSNIGYLGELEILDLSYNNLSGQVPTSIGSLNSLTELILAYNQLSGSLPVLPKQAAVNITGNPGLTNTTSNVDTGSKKKRHTLLIIIIALAGALIGLCLLAVIVTLSLSKKVYRIEDEQSPSEEGVAQITSGRLVTMNSIHASAIDFMKAMEAVSNYSNIFLKTRFCTYYKAVMPNGSTYYVKKLNWSDKIFQIGSQEKFGHEIEVLGKLSNSNVMVPLAYVLTEDNAYLLYEHVHKGTVFDFLHGAKSDILDWPSRYSIALGVAQGLTFLHGCTQPVLLLDLSTRTIHLKTVNEPQIGDIELYKIIDPSKSTGSLSTIAGTVGYIPPEYAYTMRLTMAGNVYSFGVILLELLTGKPSVSDGTELAKWALSLSGRPDQREQILDTRVSGTSIAVHSQMLSVLNIALSCVVLSPDARPKMRNVLRMLFNAK